MEYVIIRLQEGIYFTLIDFHRILELNKLKIILIDSYELPVYLHR